MDYYILSNRLRSMVQVLENQFQGVFEISLNSSLLTERLKGQGGLEKIFETISLKVGAVSREMHESLKQLIQEANELTTISLINNRVQKKLDILEGALKLVHGENNVHCVQRAVSSIEKVSKEYTYNAKTTLDRIQRQHEKLLGHNEKIWVTLTNLKIEMAQDERAKGFAALAEELDDIHIKVEKQIKSIFDSISEIQVILDSEG